MDSQPISNPSRAVKLVTPGQVVVATMLGGPLAGGIALAIAHGRAQTGRAWIPLLVGVALMAALVAVAVRFDGAPSSGFAIVGVVAMWQLAVAQDPGLRAAVGGRARPASWLGTIALSIGLLVAAGAVAVGVVVATTLAVPSVSYGRDQDVQYVGDATTADARMVGSFLMGEGIFASDGKGRTVRVSRTHAGVVVSFVVGDGAWDRAPVIEGFTEIQHKLAELFPGEKLTVDLCDDMMDNHHTIE